MQRMQGMMAGLSTSELTDYSKRKVPEPLVPRSRIFGIRERVDYAGDVIGPLVEEDVRAAAAKIRELDVESVAVTYLWSFKNPAHEKRTAQMRIVNFMPPRFVRSEISRLWMICEASVDACRGQQKSMKRCNTGGQLSD